MDTVMGDAPRVLNRAAFSGVRASAVTVCPERTSAWTAGPPIAPVPPATNTFMIAQLAHLATRVLAVD
jgi:hypothetical protein